MSTASPSAADFDRLYASEDDPWRVATSWYEQRKISVVLACLAEPRHERALDPACGTGHLAAALAGRCGEVVAADASALAIERATQICVAVGNVTLAVRALPYESGEPTLGPQASGDPTSGQFDLVVLSEFLYYLDVEERRSAVNSVLARTAPRVEIVIVHWRERPERSVTSGEQVHDELRAWLKAAGLRHQVAHFDEEFVLDVFTRGHDHSPQ